MSKTIARIPQPRMFKRCTEFGRAFALGFTGLLLGLGSIVANAAEPQSESRLIPEIKWDTTLNKFQFDADKFIGQRLTVKCPPAAVGQSFAGVYGTDFYPSDNSICIAALHAGKITKEGGTVTIQLNPGKPKYLGSKRNGVETSGLPKTRRSMTFVDDSSSDEIHKIHLAHIPRIDWETKFTRSGFGYRRLIGQRFTFRCPPAPSNLRARIVYGTDTYDFSSMICRAALHAGKITTKGGIVTVEIGPGVPKFVGSIRNGIETKSKGGSDRSLIFVDHAEAKKGEQPANK